MSKTLQPWFSFQSSNFSSKSFDFVLGPFYASNRITLSDNDKASIQDVLAQLYPAPDAEVTEPAPADTEPPVASKKGSCNCAGPAKPGVLSVRLVSGKDLSGKTFRGTRHKTDSDPYVEITGHTNDGNAFRKRSGFVNNSNNPIWDQNLYLDVPILTGTYSSQTEGTELKFAIRDYDSTSRDDDLGWLKI